MVLNKVLTHKNMGILVSVTCSLYAIKDVFFYKCTCIVA
jgi:hypothetical protein